MIRIKKGQINTVVVTLTEESTLPFPVYLFKFTNQQSHVDYYFMAKDESQFTYRYNKFFVTEKNNPDTRDGQISLPLEGFYDYVAYQTTLSTPFEVATAADAVPFIDRIVEYGLVWVEFNPLNKTVYNPDYSGFKVYNPHVQQWFFSLEDLSGFIALENRALITQE